MKTNIKVRTIKTGEIMFASLDSSDKKGIKRFMSFYMAFKERGVNKYHVSLAKNNLP